jgi:hypothetical protein
VLLWGDSHAQHFAEGLQDFLLKQKRAALMVVTAGCPPVLGATIVNQNWSQSTLCADQVRATYAEVKRVPEISHIALAARWARYTESTPFGRETGRTLFAIDEETNIRSIEMSRRVLLRRLTQMAEGLVANGKSVIFIDQIPEMGLDAGRCVALRLARGGDPSGCSIARAIVETRQSAATRMLREIAERVPRGVAISDPKKALCDEKSCRAAQGRTPLYRDDDHLNAFGSRWIAEEVFGGRL